MQHSVCEEICQCGLEFNLKLERFSMYDSLYAFKALKGAFYFSNGVSHCSVKLFGMSGTKGSWEKQKEEVSFSPQEGQLAVLCVTNDLAPFPTCFPELSGDGGHRRKMACFLSYMLSEETHC